MRCDNVNPLDVHEINRRSVSNSNSEETVVSIGPIYMKKKPKPEEIQSLILENDQQVNVKRGIFTGLLINPRKIRLILIFDLTVASCFFQNCALYAPKQSEGIFLVGSFKPNFKQNP